MAPKGKSPSVKQEDLKQEDIIQAVVFADSFNSNFAPVSDDKPRVKTVFSCYLSKYERQNTLLSLLHFLQELVDFYE